jgi:hypothetical protein
VQASCGGLPQAVVLGEVVEDVLAVSRIEDPA